MYAGEWLDALLSPEIQAFIHENEKEDPFRLSLKYRQVEGVPVSIIAAQIRSRQKAQGKLPEWFSHDCIVFPPAENLEQASSELTARFKSTLMEGGEFVDLTGGTGIDTYYISQHFNRSIYVEEKQELCQLAKHNFECLKQSIHIENNDAHRFLQGYKPDGTVAFFLDPSRRDESRQRVVRLEDCSPDAREICEMIFELHGTCLLKLSPMLDIDETRRELQNRIANIFIVAVDGEVKELLMQTHYEPVENPVFTAVDLYSKKDTQKFSFQQGEEEEAEINYADSGAFIYESSAALRKSGAFKLIASRYGLTKIARNTHLYFSDNYLPQFQGRAFRIKNIIPYQPKKLKSQIGSDKANITARNFPEEVAEIRRKSRISDGGKIYLFCFTDRHENRMVAICEKP